MFDPSELSRYGALSLLARQVVEGFLSGYHRSPYKGYSVEFAEHRQYSPGDEIRHIDWRAFGKTDRFFVKEFQDETNLKAYLVVDASGSMAYQGSRALLSKFAFAQRVAASLAYLMLHQRDAVGLIVHDSRLRKRILPRANPKQLLPILSSLEAIQPQGETNLSGIWDSLAEQHLKKRGLIILLSDCFAPIEPLGRASHHLRHRKHEVILLHILAPDEIDFPFQAGLQFRHLEKKSERQLIDSRRFRADYLEQFETFCQQLREQTGRLRIDYQMMRTDQPVDAALGLYLSRRAG